MSVIRKKPFIESVIESLTDEQKASLLSVMNGSENTVNASFTDLPEADVAPVLFQLEPNNLKTGILIQAETYDVLLAYHRFQDMQIYKLDLSKFTYEKINEYLDINELRRVLSGDVGTSVVANPELAGTESSLTGLEVDGEKYKIPEGTEVIANPTLSGTESPLTGLQVGDTKYAVGGGTKLYKHIVAYKRYNMSGTPNINLYFFIINNSQTPYTIESFSNDIANNFATKPCPVYLKCFGSSDTLEYRIYFFNKISKTTYGANTTYEIELLYYSIDENNALKCNKYTISGAITHISSTFSDTVTEL